jgi:SH3 domain-containing YSC84-like protein 1
VRSMIPVFVSCLALGLPAVSSAQVTDRLESAALALEEIMQTPDKSVPADLLARAECLVLVPGVRREPSSATIERYGSAGPTGSAERDGDRLRGGRSGPDPDDPRMRVAEGLDLAEHDRRRGRRRLT